MTELDIYKFLLDKNVECHKHQRNGGEDVIAFIDLKHLPDFQKVIGSSIMDDEGLEVHMKDGYIAIWMKDICEYHGIEMENVFSALATQDHLT